MPYLQHRYNHLMRCHHIRCKGLSNSGNGVSLLVTTCYCGAQDLTDSRYSSLASKQCTDHAGMLWVACPALGGKLLAGTVSAAQSDRLEHALSACLVHALDLHMLLHCCGDQRPADRLPLRQGFQV